EGSRASVAGDLRRAGDHETRVRGSRAWGRVGRARAGSGADCAILHDDVVSMSNAYLGIGTIRIFDYAVNSRVVRALHRHGCGEIGQTGIAFQVQSPGAVHYPRPDQLALYRCRRVITDRPAKMRGSRSVWQRTNAYHDYDNCDDVCHPPRSFVLHLNPPNWHSPPVSPKAAWAA